MDQRTKAALDALWRGNPAMRAFAAMTRPELSPVAELRAALLLILSRDDAGELFDRIASEGGYQSQELEDAMAVVRRFVGGD